MKMHEFGARLKQFRQRAGLSISQLASHSGVDYMQISRYEKGQTLPSLDTAVRLAIVLQVPLDDLVTGTAPPAIPTFQNARLLERMRQLDRLPPDRQEIALRILDTVIAGHELEDLGRRLQRS
jgi:transcriptional regulator with XRE-family HTH domain